MIPYDKTDTTFSDMDDRIEKMYNKWIFIFQNLFIRLLLKVPNFRLDISSNVSQYYKNVLFEQEIEINDLIKKHLWEKDAAIGKFESLAAKDLKKYLKNVDVSVYTNDKISSIGQFESTPQIKFVEAVFGETSARGMGNGGTINIIRDSGFPVLNFVPSISKLYDGDIEDKNEGDISYIEIDRPQLYALLAPIKSHIDENGNIDELEGAVLFKRLVLNYASFALALNLIAERINHNKSASFISEIYDTFCKSYQSAIITQSYMYELVNSFGHTPFGYHMCILNSMKWCVSSYQLLKLNNNWITATLKELMVSPKTEEIISKYMKFVNENMNGLESSICKIDEDMKEVKRSFGRIVTKCINIVLDAINALCAAKGDAKVLWPFREELTKIIGALKFNAEFLSDFQNIANVGIRVLSTYSLNGFGITDQIMEIFKSQKINIDILNPGPYSNRSVANQVAAKYPFVMWKSFKDMSINSATCESTPLLREIHETKHSNAALRELKADMESFEDLEGMPVVQTISSLVNRKMKCDCMIEAYENSECNTDSPENSQFISVMKAASRKIGSTISEIVTGIGD